MIEPPSRPTSSPGRATAPAAGPPAPLRPDDPVSRLPGVGAARAAAYARLGVGTIEDLLRLAPRHFEDRRRATPVAELVAGREATVVGTVRTSRASRTRTGLAVVEAKVADGTGEVSVKWFNQPWLVRTLPPGVRVVLYGPPARGAPRAELVAPSVERLPEGGEAHPSFGRFVPVHPLTRGLSALAVRRAVWAARPVAAALQDVLPARWREQVPVGALPFAALPSIARAAVDLHFPSDPLDAETARVRLAFDEFLVHELVLRRRRARRRSDRAPALRFTPELHRRIRARFPFVLTPAQERAVAAVCADLASKVPMHRLLQGDVGAGKTLVAVYACLAAVANGVQAAFVAPTEVLARQHEATLRSWLAGSEVRVEALYGARRGKARAAALARIEAGEADLVVGTHAVLSSGVRFASLGLAVVDEQHKFGVAQRHDLVTKGACPHVLVMTATPIPRTLAMVVYGDLDVTTIEGLPPGRGRRTTWLVRPSQGAEVLARVAGALAAGRQAFVVYPLVEASDAGGLRDATAGHAAWARALPGRRVGLVHGRMKAAERDAVMDAFRAGRLDVLVATVVVEVGVDVPNATVLVVEHAERFGLSQLHQLRGRVGRGTGDALCVLVNRAEGPVPERLEVLAAVDDGFQIAEHDLRLRGAGDLLGTRQHGAPAFCAARLPADLGVLVAARTVADRLALADPGLAADELAPLRSRLQAREAELGAAVEG